MANAMDKFLNIMKFNDDEDEGYDTEEFIDEDDEPVRARASRENQGGSSRKMMTRKKGNGKDDSMEVCVIRPTSVEDSKDIASTLLSNRAVVLNLEGIDLAVAQRIIDFTLGATYAIKGNLQKISSYIFIITPASVDISGDFQDSINGVESIDVPM